MKQISLRFTLHRQCQDMFETYRRDGRVGQSALDNYQRTAAIQTELRRTLRPAPRTPTSAAIATDADVKTLKMAAHRMRTTVSHGPTADALLEVSYG